MTHCDKKPRGKVGGSAISVYQALLHPPIESLGTRLVHDPVKSCVSMQVAMSLRSHLKPRQGCRKVVKSGGGNISDYVLLVVPYTSWGGLGACPPENFVL